MLSLFQETLEDVIGQLFKPDKVLFFYLSFISVISYSKLFVAFTRELDIVSIHRSC